MCFHTDSTPPVRAIAGAAVSHDPLTLTAADGNQFAAFLATPETPMLSLTLEPLISTHAVAKEKEVAELFDKYNLSTLPVVDDNRKLTGVITSDDIISLLRAKL